MLSNQINDNYCITQVILSVISHNSTLCLQELWNTGLITQIGLQVFHQSPGHTKFQRPAQLNKIANDFDCAKPTKQVSNLTASQAHWNRPVAVPHLKDSQEPGLESIQVHPHVCDELLSLPQAFTQQAQHLTSHWSNYAIRKHWKQHCCQASLIHHPGTPG